MFNQCCDFFVTDLFIWTISTLATSLYTFESVEYILCCFCVLLHLFSLTHFPNGKCVVVWKVIESSSNPMEWSKPFFSMFWSFIFIWVYCEFGQQFVAEQFELFNDELGKGNWYLFPNKTQRMILILIANANAPTFVRGVGNIICARKAFKKVIPHIHFLCSIFMISFLFLADN